MFFLWLIIILIIFAIIIATSKIKLEIDDLEFILPKVKNKYINPNFKIRLKIYILNIIKIADIDLNKNQKEKLKQQIKKIETKSGDSGFKFDLDILKYLKEIKTDFEKINLKIYLGTEDAAVTAILIGIISGILGFLLKEKVEDIEKQKFLVIPVYQDINVLKIELNGIFSIKMRNIINTIYKLIKKRRVEENGRTSNRRSYAYSNE